MKIRHPMVFATLYDMITESWTCCSQRAFKRNIFFKRGSHSNSMIQQVITWREMITSKRVLWRISSLIITDFNAAIIWRSFQESYGRVLWKISSLDIEDFTSYYKRLHRCNYIKIISSVLWDRSSFSRKTIPSKTNTIKMVINSIISWHFK